MTERIFFFNAMVVLVGALIALYWLFVDPIVRPPITLNIDPMQMQVQEAVYRPGDTIYIYTDFCKHRDSYAQTAWSLVDTIMLPYPEKYGNFPRGCYKGWYEAVKLPNIGVEGEYHLRGTTIVQLNPLVTVTYDYQTEPFTIVQ